MATDLRVSLARSVLIATIAIALPRPAAAQLLHDLPPPPVAEVGATGDRVGAGTRMEIATTTINASSPASYQGFSIHAHAHLGPVVFAAHASLYRLDHELGTELGPGDVELAAWLPLLRRRAYVVGGGLPVMLPTGDANRGLGMGHPMLMPTVYATARRGSLDAIVVGSYHRAIDASGHVLRGIHGSLVNPMTPSEVTSAARGTWWVAPVLGVVAEVAVTVPTSDEPTRAAAGVGARFRRGAVDLNAIVQLGLAGDPFGTRAVIELRMNR